MFVVSYFFDPTFVKIADYNIYVSIRDMLIFAEIEVERIKFHPSLGEIECILCIPRVSLVDCDT